MPDNNSHFKVIWFTPFSHFNFLMLILLYIFIHIMVQIVQKNTQAHSHNYSAMEFFYDSSFRDYQIFQNTDIYFLKELRNIVFAPIIPLPRARNLFYLAEWQENQIRQFDQDIADKVREHGREILKTYLDISGSLHD